MPVYMKFIEQEQLDEANIHLYLSRINDEHNRTIPVLETYKTNDGGAIIVTMDGGVRLDSLTMQGSAGDRYLKIVQKIFEGIEFMHDKGVQHNDLKPANIVISETDEKPDTVYIIDYSLATRSCDVSGSCRLRGEFLGTEGWTAPEVGRGKPYDAAKADVWAAGKVVFEFCMGMEPVDETWEFIRRICVELMDPDPTKRPQIKDVSSRVKARMSN